jgi:hypothetical protein
MPMPTRVFFPNKWCRIAALFFLSISQASLVRAQQDQAPAATQPPAQPTPAPQTTQPSAPVASPATLTNQDILDMNKMGLSADILVAKIKSSPCDFDTSPAQLQQLKSSGLADEVILAMVQAPVGQPTTATPDAPTSPSAGSTAPTSPPNDGKTRVFVTDSESWEMRGAGSGGGNKNGWGASSSMSGGARPQTAEIIKTLNQRCPEMTVTDNLGRADFVLTLDHEGGKGALERRNKLAVFNRDGDDIFSVSTRELGNSVKDACDAMLKTKK